MISETPKTESSLAQKTLHRALSRRSFFKTAGAAGGLAIVWRTGALAQDATPSASPIALPPSSNLVDNYNPAPNITILKSPTDVDAYLAIDQDGNVTLKTSLVDFGQGIETGFMQIVAEELGTAFEKVSLIMGQVDEVPFNIGTFGSLSTQVSGPIFRSAAATMREWLLDLGAEALGVDRSDVVAENGGVVSKSDPNKQIGFGDLAGGKASSKQIDAKVTLKDPSTYTIVGQPIPRVHALEKVTGRSKYGIDSALPGMIHAKLVRPPQLGAQLQDIDFSEAEKVPGYVGSFRDGNFAAVVADRYEHAAAAVQAVKATWSEVKTGNTSENIHEVLRSTADAGRPLGAAAVGEGTPTPVPATPLPAAQTLKLTFQDQYVNHAPIEPKAALVNVTADRVDVWASSQTPHGVQAAVAAQLGIDTSKVSVHTLLSGGAFGSKILANPELPAAVLSAHFGKPVKLIWDRSEEFQYAQFRPAMVVDVTTGLTSDGKITSWTYDAYSAAYYPEGAKTATDSASDWGADVTEIYSVDVSKSTLFGGHAPLPPYYWRVNGASTNAFARETTITQLAELAGKDPLSFRLELLDKNPRMAAVLQAVVDQAGWTPGVGSSGKGFGLACAFDASSYVAQVAQVKIDESTGVISVERVDCVIDCGLIVNPEGVRHQVEGAIVLSLSPTLKEAITFDNGKVTNPSWAQYNPLHMNEAPRQIEVGFVEDKSNPISGVGEPAVAPVPAAVAAAVYDAVGVWLYEMPFTPDRVLAALQNAGKATPAATPAS
ncbi:MAG: molybdopterin-dependent oxidoreductase [Thermomicrobiales bacterium]